MRDAEVAVVRVRDGGEGEGGGQGWMWPRYLGSSSSNSSVIMTRRT